ncbi:MAG TPA: HEAT repeat domain-containing protein [Spirochaetota bacterium]|nr:HEAT repeat domain-containing protein [Spirochaetota bacterium]
MQIIKEQLKKIYHFLLLLVLLYSVNLGFNMLYDWGGVSVIVRVYIMVLSCYIIYNFSQLDAGELREEYKKDYGRMGVFYLFLVIRIFPFLFIYLMTVIFTLINYVQSHGWPVETILKLMDGRYSNTVIYALILFVVLRLKIRPGISIPVFIAAAIFYFYTDKLLYRLFDPGVGVSFIKLFKFVIFYFILLYGYSKQTLKVFYTVITAASAGVVTFTVLVTVYFAIFFFSAPGGKIYSNTAETLLKYGFYSVFYPYEKSIEEQNSVQYVSDLIRFSDKSGREITFTAEKWEKIIVMSGARDAEKIFRHLYRKRIMLNYEIISEYAVRQSTVNPDFLTAGIYFKKYFALYYSENSEDFFSIYKRGDFEIRKWIIDLLGYVHDYDAIIFLINRLTDPDRKISEKAYESLRQLTKLDPAHAKSKEIHDLDVVDRFREYAEKIRKR